MHRTLHLTNPHMKGQDVEDAQWLMNRAGYSTHLNIDGDFGIATATAAKETKWFLGYPAEKCIPNFGQVIYDYLTKKEPLSKDYVKRGKERLAAISGDVAKRHKTVEYGLWGIRNERSIHYAQYRPMDLMGDLLHLPVYNDCSEFVTKAYKYGGLPDPNGWHFGGIGNTETLLQHMREISKENIRLADLIVWGNLPNSHHVAMVIELGRDPVLVSHGQERGPLAIRFSTEHRYQNYRTAHWLTLP